MPSYDFLMKTSLDTRELLDKIQANREVGVPYTDDMMANVMADVQARVNELAGGCGATEALSQGGGTQVQS